MSTYYRIHSADESLDTILDVSRKDGWTMADEAELSGLAVCTTLEGLRYYAREYGMSIGKGDRLVRVEGRHIGPDHDAHAVRIVATSYEVLGDARDWYRNEGAFAESEETDEEDA